MKTMEFYLILLMTAAVASLAYAEHFRATTGDLYEQSYSANMMKQTGGYSAVNELRASEYRSQNQVCDENHNCGASQTVKTREGRAGRVEEMMETFHFPVLG